MRVTRHMLEALRNHTFIANVMVEFSCGHMRPYGSLDGLTMEQRCLLGCSPVSIVSAKKIRPTVFPHPAGRWLDEL